MTANPGLTLAELWVLLDGGPGSPPSDILISLSGVAGGLGTLFPID
jgi:hypothetical protein